MQPCNAAAEASGIRVRRLEQVLLPKQLRLLTEQVGRWSGSHGTACMAMAGIMHHDAMHMQTGALAALCI